MGAESEKKSGIELEMGLGIGFGGETEREDLRLAYLRCWPTCSPVRQVGGEELQDLPETETEGLVGRGHPGWSDTQMGVRLGDLN